MKYSPPQVDLTLSRSDRALILSHGYPFPSIEAAIHAVPASTDIAVVSCEAGDVGLLLGDLARSINNCKNRGLQEQLDELFESIESETGL